ncbi:MAG: 50S ribosomal protein L19 [Leptospiraceae bacterium]|nr:50S ribosomal protein L19 [Leptospiraceae bacterium]MBK9501228.1 50S ribosomal protein L19 [Leptospiraceae bacterium]MBL0265890.1 50S ribosomal protein L19 [Leptospiraceae bacterium]MBP9162515.1 50S ribosomal protein L19 [Leptospiraceae bacterium]HRG47059.1 50S ribosomal protein L19 [Leptospiraceae bacterium]
MNHEIAKLFESDLNRRKINFSVGDTVKVHYKIVESGKERTQIYEGVVISIVNKMNDKSFNVRRVSYDIGVERIFPLYSPKISKIELVRKGHVRRAKLYFLREKSGKTARIKELRGGQAIVQAERKKEKELAQSQKDAATEAQVTAAA